jgi:hypothetical protein
MQLHLINSKMEIIRPIITNGGGFLSATLDMDFGGAYILTIEITPDLPVYSSLKSGLFGLRLIDNDNDIAFFEGKTPSVNLMTGVITLTFYSSSWRLKYSQRLLQENELYKSFAFALIQNLNPNFVFELLGMDQYIELNTGVLNNLALLEDVCKTAKGWNWRDEGVVNVNGINKTKILIGEYSQIIAKYRATNRFYDDPFGADTIKINSIKQTLTGDAISHLLIISDTGQGSESSTIIFPNEQNASYVLSEYPLIDQNKIIRGQKAYYIQDINNNIGYEKYETLVIQNAVSAQELYQKGVAYIKSKQDYSIYEYEFSFPKIILPGEKVKVQYRHSIDAINGDTYSVLDIDTTQTLRQLKFDLSKLKE